MTKVPGDERIAIGLPRGPDTGYRFEWIESLFMMFGTSPCNYKMINSNKVHHQARNEIMENFLETDMNYLLFIDSDMIFQPDSLELAYNLIQQDGVDIVTGIYYTKGEPHLPVIKKLDLEAGCYNIFMDWGNEPFEVDGAGMGFMLIPKYVLKKMKQPLCEWKGGFSEDLNFCLKVKKDHGFKIWAEPRIKLGHIGNKIITDFDWVQQYKPAMKSFIREAMIGTKLWLQKTYPNWREELGIHPMNFKNVNTQKYWDEIYKRERGIGENPRVYPEKTEFLLHKILKNLTTERVLELGCGVGVFASELKKKYPNVFYYGIDISQVAIDELTKAGFAGEAREIPPISELTEVMESNVWDVVIGLEFLEHLDEDKRLQTIKETSKIIDNKGMAVFSVPDDCMPPDDVAEHRVKYNERQFERFLKKAFSQVKTYKVKSRWSLYAKVLGSYLIAVCKN